MLLILLAVKMAFACSCSSERSLMASYSAPPLNSASGEFISRHLDSRSCCLSWNPAKRDAYLRADRSWKAVSMLASLSRRIGLFGNTGMYVSYLSAIFTRASWNSSCVSN